MCSRITPGQGRAGGSLSHTVSYVWATVLMLQISSNSRHKYLDSDKWMYKNHPIS